MGNSVSRRRVEKVEIQGPSFQCFVCYETFPPTARPSKLSCCDHEQLDICKPCLAKNISAAPNHPRCPLCIKALSYNDVLLHGQQADADRCARGRLLRKLSKDPGFRWCLQDGCGAGQLHRGFEAKITCYECGAKSCFTHNIPWHEGQTCQEYEASDRYQSIREEERMTTRYMNNLVVRKEAKLCPLCSIPIVKETGCDHMTCTLCRLDFSWKRGK